MICRNPILPGFYPDPSICRVGEDYYLVNSTFAYFPGIPLFHSRNLAEWEQVGNVLTRNSQVNLAGCGHSEGIYAPTIRFHQGIYYVIATNVSGGGNFVVTAKHPEGPWSEPYYLGEAAPGIDPSLFFEEDGTCWYIGNRTKREAKYFGDCELWVQQLDLSTMRLVGESHAIWDGFQKHAVWPEGPHLYKKDGYYYLIYAEGGTELNHCVAAARSHKLLGPYESCPHNPILTHRHLGMSAAVTCVGHGDLVEDGRGNWYLVTLASRPIHGQGKNLTLLGRESFLAKVAWEDGWPVVNPGVGLVTDCVEVTGEISRQQKGNMSVRNYIFGGRNDHLPPEFLMLRNPEKEAIRLLKEEGVLRLSMQPFTLRDLASPSYVALRQQQVNYQVETDLRIHFIGPEDCAGLAIVQNNENQVRFELYKAGGELRLRVVNCRQGQEHVEELKRQGQKYAEQMEDYPAVSRKEASLSLRLQVQGLLASLFIREHGVWREAVRGISLDHLSTEAAGGFVGCTVGMYASGGNQKSRGYADFLRFSICTLKKTSSAMPASPAFFDMYSHENILRES